MDTNVKQDHEKVKVLKPSLNPNVQQTIPLPIQKLNVHSASLSINEMKQITMQENQSPNLDFDKKIKLKSATIVSP